MILQVEYFLNPGCDLTFEFIILFDLIFEKLLEIVTHFWLIEPFLGYVC